MHSKQTKSLVAIAILSIWAASAAPTESHPSAPCKELFSILQTTTEQGNPGEAWCQILKTFTSARCFCIDCPEHELDGSELMSLLPMMDYCASIDSSRTIEEDAMEEGDEYLASRDTEEDSDAFSNSMSTVFHEADFPEWVFEDADQAVDNGSNDDSGDYSFSDIFDNIESDMEELSPEETTSLQLGPLTRAVLKGLTSDQHLAHILNLGDANEQELDLGSGLEGQNIVVNTQSYGRMADMEPILAEIQQQLRFPSRRGLIRHWDIDATSVRYTCDCDIMANDLSLFHSGFISSIKRAVRAVRVAMCEFMCNQQLVLATAMILQTVLIVSVLVFVAKQRMQVRVVRASDFIKRGELSEPLLPIGIKSVRA